MTTNDGTVGRYLGWFLVALSLGAGAIHFAVAGGHFDVTWYHGTFLAVVAWLQLMWAAAIFIRPTRPLLALAVFGNALVMGVWVLSRVWGLPIGPDSGEPESVTLADGLATGFEAGIVVLALAVLFRPALAQRSLRPQLGLAGIGTTGIAIAIVSTLALTPSYASDHHGSGGHSDSAEEAADHDHADMAAHDDSADSADAAAHDDAAGAAHADATGVVIQADGSWPCEESGISNDGNAAHGHRGPVPDVPMDAATRDLFRAQVAQADALVAALPTVRDAEAAGYKAITPYVPCIAAHYIKYDILDGTFDPANPEIVLYDGNSPDSHVVGLSYLVVVDESSNEQPEGFAGDIDAFHVHATLCVAVGGGIRGDESTTNEECEQRGGTNVDLGNLWMDHMWNAPGEPNPWGLFASEHANLGGWFGDRYGEPRPQDMEDEDDD